MKLRVWCLALLCAFVFSLTACEAKAKNSVTSASVISSAASSVSSVSSSQEESSTVESEPEEKKILSPVVEADAFPGLETYALDFPQYDPASALSYDEYFSTERYLNSYELNSLRLYREYTIGAMTDMPGYRYVKGWDDDSFDPHPWSTAYDNLYLLCEETNERLLLAELDGIREMYVFLDCLYLTTEKAVWRCGRLGENLTCVYEHPTQIYSNPANCSAECFYFVAEGEPWTQNHDDEKEAKKQGMFPDSETVIWRLYLPTGQVDKVCVVEELAFFDWEVGARNGYRPLSNYAFLTTDYEGEAQKYVYSVRTGDQSVFAEGAEHEKVAYWDAWVRKYYPLNQY